MNLFLVHSGSQRQPNRDISETISYYSRIIKDIKKTIEF